MGNHYKETIVQPNNSNIVYSYFTSPISNFFSNNESVTTDSDARGYVVLIIDDFGNNGNGTEEMLKLNVPVTAAVMPFMPFSKADALAAKNANLEVILHLSMEPNQGKKNG